MIQSLSYRPCTAVRDGHYNADEFGPVESHTIFCLIRPASPSIGILDNALVASGLSDSTRCWRKYFTCWSFFPVPPSATISLNSRFSDWIRRDFDDHWPVFEVLFCMIYSMGCPRDRFAVRHSRYSSAGGLYIWRELLTIRKMKDENSILSCSIRNGEQGDFLVELCLNDNTPLLFTVMHFAMVHTSPDNWFQPSKRPARCLRQMFKPFQRPAIVYHRSRPVSTPRTIPLPLCW